MVAGSLYLDEQFQLFFDRHYRELGRLAYLMADEAEAADALAVAALAAARERWEHVRTSGSPTEYLWTLLVRQVTKEDHGAGPRGRAGQAAAAGSLTVRDALARLPARGRACLVLRYAFGLSEGEVARMVGISADAVESEMAEAGPELERALGIGPGIATGRTPAATWFATDDDPTETDDSYHVERLRPLLSEEAGRYEPSRARMLEQMLGRVTPGSEPGRRWSTPPVTTVASAVAVTAVIAAAVVFANAGAELSGPQSIFQAAPLPADFEPTVPLSFGPVSPSAATPSSANLRAGEESSVEVSERSVPNPSASGAKATGSPSPGDRRSPSPSAAPSSAPSASPTRSRTSRSSTPKPSSTRSTTTRTSTPRTTSTRSTTTRTSAPKTTPTRVAPQQQSASLVPGSVVSLESADLPGYRVRHRNFRGRLDPIGASSSAADRADASFAVRQGLANPSCVSLEATNYPGYFLRHRNFEIHLQRHDGSGLYAADATFCPQGGGQSVSLRSHNYPTHYMQHSGGLLYLRSGGGSAFTVRPGL
jgi:DNA-directed RNA polymerase specialized sigma24 family protein